MVQPSSAPSGAASQPATTSSGGRAGKRGDSGASEAHGRTALLVVGNGGRQQQTRMRSKTSRSSDGWVKLGGDSVSACAGVTATEPSRATTWRERRHVKAFASASIVSVGRAVCGENLRGVETHRREGAGCAGHGLRLGSQATGPRNAMNPTIGCRLQQCLHRSSSEKAVEVVRNHAGGTRLAPWQVLAEDDQPRLAVGSGRTLRSSGGGDLEEADERDLRCACRCRHLRVMEWAGSGSQASTAETASREVRWSRSDGNVASGRVREWQAIWEDGGTTVSS
jgi:hypothetical protein